MQGLVLLGLLCLGLLSGCAGRRPVKVGPDGVIGPVSGLYRVTLRDPVEGQRRFRLLLFAELPDRIHGEILTPVGTVVMIFDGGGGQLAVTFVRDRLAFAGPASEEALERVLGVRLSLEDLVGAILSGQVPADVEILREGAASPALPERLELKRGPRSMTLELKRLQPLRSAGSNLGNGEPAVGLEVRPLSELQLHDPVNELEPQPPQEGSGS